MTIEEIKNYDTCIIEGQKLHLFTDDIHEQIELTPEIIEELRIPTLPDTDEILISGGSNDDPSEIPTAMLRWLMSWGNGCRVGVGNKPR